MTRFRPNAPILLAGLLTLLPCTARADQIGFSYSWTVAATDLSGWGIGPITLSQNTAADGSAVTVNYGGGTATLTVAPAGSASATPGGADFFSAVPVAIPLGTLMTPGLTGPVGTFSFSANNQLTLHLTDSASGQSGDLTFFGSVGGTVAPDGTTSLGASEYSWSFQSLVLGGHTYTADAVNNLPGSAPGSAPVGLAAQVYVDRPAPPWWPIGAGGGPGPAALPEPSGLLLAGSALSLLGAATLRKRRRGG